MALAEKYRVHVDHQFGGDSRYVQIYKEGYSGSVTELTSGAAPAVLEYPGNDNNIYDPVFGSELVLTIWNTTDGQFAEFAAAKNKDYLAVLYNDTAAQIEWQGWLLPREVEEPHNQPPYQTVLIFNCGLGLLANYDYLDTDGSYLTGRATELAIIVNCLELLYPSTMAAALRPDIRIAVSLMETTMSLAMSANPMNLTYVNQEKYVNEDGTVWKCLDVIRDILSTYGARICAGLVGWWIVRIRDYGLLYDSYEIPYQQYDADGAYQAYSSMTTANVVETVTGPQARSSMIGWIMSTQMSRHERAYKEIKLIQDYVYKNLILLGTFNSENWTDFWTIGGTPTRVQANDRDNEYYIRIASTETFYQIIEDINPPAIGSNLIFNLSFEFMMEYLDTVTHTNFRIAIEIDYDTASTDYSLHGEIGGGSASDPAWQANTTGLVYVNYASGEMKPGVWNRVTLSIPDPPTLQGDMRIKFAIGSATGGSGSIDATSYKDVKVYPSYATIKFPTDNVTKIRDMSLDISDDNIEEMGLVTIYLGDVDVDTNEGVFFFGSKTTESAGITPTVDWVATRRQGVNKVAVGLEQPLMDYLQEGYIVQHAATRKRITGRMSANSRKWGYVVISEDSVYYLPVEIRVDLKRGEVDLSIVEIPQVEGLLANLITSWTNVDFDTFASTGDLITNLDDGVTRVGTANADTVAWIAYENFRLEVTYDTYAGTGHASVQWGVVDIQITGNGMDVVIQPGTTDGSGAVVLQNDGSYIEAYTNLRIKITKVYGY
jgi:hypothetical protein